MNRTTTRLQQEEIRRFLATGQSDPLSSAWEGGPLEGGRRAKNALISALLEIDFPMRETFAYACEAYGRILELGPRSADRRRLLDEHLAGAMPGDDRVEEEEYCSVITEAVGARNGWKRILRRCAPATASKRA